MKLTIEQLAKQLGAELTGNANAIRRQIIAVCPINTAEENEVTFVTDDKNKAALSQSHAGAVIVSARIDGLDKPQLIVKNVNAALIETLKIFAPKIKAVTEGIDPTAKLAGNVKIAKGVYVGANVVIDEGVEIGKNSIIGNGCKIGENSKLGEHSRLDSNVVIYQNCHICSNVIIQANSMIGSTGFG